MATFVESSFQNRRGQKIYCRKWLANNPKAFLVFHHGYGSHSGAYDGEMKRIAESGISVYLIDAHSFGRSEPLDPKLRSLVLDFTHLPDDVYTFREEVVDKDQTTPPVPVFMGGLSMGGFTSILTVTRDQQRWAGLILLSPLVDCLRTFQLRVMELVQGVVLKIAPNARLVPQPVIPAVTLNKEERKNLETDEFFDPKRIRVRSARSFLDGMSYIAQHERELTLPVLIHYSTIDTVVYPPATERFAKNVASKDVTLKPIDKYAHDIWLDDCKVESCSGVIEWILQHSGSSAGGSAGTREGGAPSAPGATPPQQSTPSDPAKL